MILTKKDLKEIKDVVVEATEPYFTAIKNDFDNIDDHFERIDKDFQRMNGRFDKVDVEFVDIRAKLSSLERRIIAIEDISTDHGKELRKIRKLLIQLQKQRKVDVEKVDLLEERVVRLEAGVV